MRQYLQKHKWHLITFVILLIITGVSWKLSLTTQNTDEMTNLQLPITNKISNDKTRTPNPDNQTPKTTKQLNNGTIEQSITNYQLLTATTSTVYDAMKGSQLNFKTKTFSGLGEFVEEINGLKNDPQSGKYWMYYINGETAKLGISTQIVKPGDLIEWKYENTNF
ncbi:DUF4430 domain-containing protein [Candidatus Falkowbacteria bacterium]|nr:DUF4430 domain-containing protein [Candidatus Falkowbacteria bacterium]